MGARPSSGFAFGPHPTVPFPGDSPVRTFEIIVALICAVILFVVLKVIGLVLKFALVAAVLGFGAGLLLARMLRRS